MIGYDLDRGGPKDSETAPNSFLTKTNGRGFDVSVLICVPSQKTQDSQLKFQYLLILRVSLVHMYSLRNQPAS